MKLRRWFVVGFAMIFIMISLAGLAIFKAGRFLSSPATVPQKVDAIIVLGGGWTERILRGAELYEQGYASKVLLIGFDEKENKTGNYLDSWKARTLIASGVDQGDIYFDAFSMNSLEEAKNALVVMVERGWRQVIVVSDPPHMRRVDLLWNRVFTGSGMKYTLVASSPSWWNVHRWWQNEISKRFVLNEYKKLVYYWFISLTTSLAYQQ
jgi:uncharacterized SAM-binding protein YcdF (DUF218 family)